MKVDTLMTLAGVTSEFTGINNSSPIISLSAYLKEYFRRWWWGRRGWLGRRGWRCSCCCSMRCYYFTWNTAWCIRLLFDDRTPSTTVITQTIRSSKSATDLANCWLRTNKFSSNRTYYIPLKVSIEFAIIKT